MLSKLTNLFNDSNIDAILINSPENLRYFSSFTGGEGVVFVTQKSNFLFTDGRFSEQAQNECRGFNVFELSGEKIYAHINEIIKNENIKKIGFEDGFITYRGFSAMCKNISEDLFIPFSEKLLQIRSVKETWELEKISKAADIADLAFSHILKHLKIGAVERDIAVEIEYFLKKHGAQKASFDTIVVSGKRSSLPHGLPTNMTFEYGDFVTMDFGCVYDGYCSDMTRTVVIGKADDEQKKVYGTVLDAQKSALNYIRAGIVCKDADEKARAIIKDAGYEDYFKHSLGHGVGLLIHEEPRLSSKCDIVLKENMVVTVEPGIYIPGTYGARIEDMVCVKNNGIINFTKSGKELIEIDY